MGIQEDKPTLIRKFAKEDEKEVSKLISKTMRVSNSADYSLEEIEKIENSLGPEQITERATWTHFYVAVIGGEIVGCGAIGPYWGREDESSLFTIFVLPSYQKQGIGRKIIEALEKDEYFLRAKRIEVPASITGVEFYKKMGYNYKDGITDPDEEHLIRLEKIR